MLFALVSFAAASALIVLLPGPDTLVVMRNLLRGGRGQAVWTVLGVLSGLTIWVSVAALGLSAVLRASHDAYLALRIVGAVYLVWLGIRSLRSRASADQLPDVRGRGLVGSGYTAGLATDLLNPKVGVFFVTFLPGFEPAGQSVGLMTVLLGAIFVAETACYFFLLLAVSGPVTRWMTTARIRRRIERITGGVLIAFGLRLVLEP